MFLPTIFLPMKIAKHLRFTKFFSTNLNLNRGCGSEEQIDVKAEERDEKKTIEKNKEKHPLYKKFTKTNFTLEGKHPYPTNGIKQYKGSNSVQRVSVKDIDQALKASEEDNKSSFY